MALALDARQGRPAAFRPMAIRFSAETERRNIAVAGRSELVVRPPQALFDQAPFVALGYGKEMSDSPERATAILIW